MIHLTGQDGTTIYLVMWVCGTTGFVHEEKFVKEGVVKTFRATHPCTKIEGVPPRDILYIVLCNSVHYVFVPDQGMCFMIEFEFNSD